MLSNSRVAVALLSLTSAVCGLAYTTPEPTSTKDNHGRVEEGWTPKPTDGPQGPAFELLKRAIAGADTCGWYGEGTSSREITCPKGTCMLFTPSGIVGMAGCCTSSSGYGSMDYQNCGWVNKCYDYADYKGAKCLGACLSNSFHRVCTDVVSPYCLSWTYPGPAVRDYGCGTASHSTWLTIEGVIQDLDAGTNTASLPYIPAAATVTGWELKQDTGTATSSRYTYNTGTSLPSTQASKTVSIAVVVAIIVVVVLGFCCAGGLVAWFCVRSKKNVAKWNKPSAVVGGALVAQQAAPLMQQQHSNIVPPAGQYGGQQQGYFPSQQAPQQGAAAGYYAEDAMKYNPQAHIQPIAAPMSAPGTPVPAYNQQYPTNNQQAPTQQRDVAELGSTPVVRGPRGGHVAELG